MNKRKPRGGANRLVAFVLRLHFDLVIFDHVTFDADKVGVNTLDDSDIVAAPIQVQMTGWLFVSHMKLESRDC